MVGTRNVLQLLLERIDCIVDGETLAWVLMIMVDDGLTCEFRHTHDAVSIVHTILLYAIDSGVHIATRAVKVGSMDVNAQRFATDILGMDTCRIGEPVMSMDDIKLLGAGYDASND